MKRLFPYGEKEISYLKQKDRRLAAVIDQVGPIVRYTDSDLFSSVIHHIIGQQISTKAQATIWQRLQDKVSLVTPDSIASLSESELQSIGISYRKASYIQDFCHKIQSGAFALHAAAAMNDEEAIRYLASLKGIGRWTAEMILLFCLCRPNIFSCDDLAIQRGLRMIYRHRQITKPLFEKYRRRFSPYGSTASLYIWAVSNGAIPELKDTVPYTKK